MFQTDALTLFSDNLIYIKVLTGLRLIMMIVKLIFFYISPAFMVIKIL